MRGMREETGRGLQFPWQSPVVQGVVRDADPGVWGLFPKEQSQRMLNPKRIL